MRVDEGARLNVASPLETAARLEAAGFADVEVWPTDEPTFLEPGAPLEPNLETVCLRGTWPGSHPTSERHSSARLPGGGRSRSSTTSG